MTARYYTMLFRQAVIKCAKRRHKLDKVRKNYGNKSQPVELTLRVKN